MEGLGRILENEMDFETWWMKLHISDFDGVTTAHVEAAWRAGAAAEREACARVCDERMAKIAAEADRAAKTEPDEVSALRAMAWQLEVTAAAVRKRAAL